MSENRAPAKSALESLVERLARIDTLASDDPAWEFARVRLADQSASLVAGLITEEGSDLYKVTSAASPNRPFGTVETIAYLSGATRLTEIDDIHIGSCTTVGSVIVPVSLAVAACGVEQQVDDRTLLRSVIAGYEAMARLGVAIDGAVRVYSGIWPTYIAGPLGAAAVSSVLLGLSDEQTAHALATAASRSVGTKTRHMGGPTSHWYMLGLSAADGYLCAVAASQGMEGDLEILERAFGKATDTVFEPAGLVGRPDDDWMVNQIDIKPFRCQRQALSATEAFRQTIADKNWRDCASVEVLVPKQYCSNVDYEEPPLHRNSPGAQYLMGLAATEYDRLYDANRTPVKNDDDIRSLMARVRIHADDELTALFPARWGARVTTTWKDGSTSAAEVLDPFGSALNPMDWTALLEKQRNVMRVTKVDDALSLQGAKKRDDWLDELFGLSRGLATSGRNSLDAIVDVLPAAFSQASKQR